MPVIRKEISDHQFVVERVNKNAFPKVGKANTLYVDLEYNILYKFDINLNEYKILISPPSIIDGGTP